MGVLPGEGRPGHDQNVVLDRLLRELGAKERECPGQCLAAIPEEALP